ncbi:MAG: threonylcarbamoyl-AMP synthase [Desulfobacterales bacterium]|nr:threonylcarbamoyl-AMP synthase [Desulfobacterales bacterium]
MSKAVSQERLSRAAACLKHGGIVAFPTETYYGLAVDPFNPAALARLFQLKQRAGHKPLLTLIEQQQQLSLLAREVPFVFQRLMARFWPGPLTLVCRARPELPAALTADTGTIGVRIPGTPVARRLVETFGRPITGTSANISGMAAATTAAGVVRQFGDRVDLVLDGGPTPGGKGSTVVGLDETGAVVLIRAGVVPFRRLAEVVGS